MSEALNRLLKVLIIAINAPSHSVDAPSPGLGDHFYPIQYDFRAAAKAISVNIPLGKLNPLLTKHNQQL